MLLIVSFLAIILGAFRITATNPPAIIDAWGVGRDGCGSPFVTSTDGTNNMIVWAVGTGRARQPGRPAITRLRRRYRRCCLCRWRRQRIDGGHALYSTTGIAARGRIYVAGDNKVYAFTLPGGTPTPTPTGTAPNLNSNGNAHCPHQHQQWHLQPRRPQPQLLRPNQQAHRRRLPRPLQLRLLHLQQRQRLPRRLRQV